MQRFALLAMALTGLAAHPAGCATPRRSPVRTHAMADAAARFVGSLGHDQREGGLFGFDDAQRTQWHIDARVPVGIPLGTLDADQRAAFDALLATALTDTGVASVRALLALEDPSVRDQDYRVALFGDPTTDDAWAWRLEGPRVSLNVDVAPSTPDEPERWTSTPFFLGTVPDQASPADAQGDPGGLEPLDEATRLARELLASLDDEQRAAAIRDDEVPDDVFFGPWRGRLPTFRPAGLRAQLMTEPQRALLSRLIDTAVGGVRDGDAQKDAFRGDHFDGVHFVWMGKPDGERFYCRIQCDRSTIELTELAPNHVHLVWRDRDLDFGGNFPVGPESEGR